MRFQCEEVALSYEVGAGTRQVLHNLNVSFDEPRVGIIGANGSGKSSFLRLLNGLQLPTYGRVLVDDRDTRSDAKHIRSETGFLFTNPDSQIIMPTVEEDIGFGLRKSPLTKAERREAVTKALRRFSLEDHRDHPAHLLSGGQKQLLALAAVLVTEPRTLIMDEPTTLLDLGNALRIGHIIENLEEQVILATHHLDLVASFDRVLCFDEQRLVADGPAHEVVAYYTDLMHEKVARERPGMTRSGVSTTDRHVSGAPIQGSATKLTDSSCAPPATNDRG